MKKGFKKALILNVEEENNDPLANSIYCKLYYCF